MKTTKGYSNKEAKYSAGSKSSGKMGGDGQKITDAGVKEASALAKAISRKNKVGN